MWKYTMSQFFDELPDNELRILVEHFHRKTPVLCGSRAACWYDFSTGGG